MENIEFYVVSDTHFGDINIIKQQPLKTSKEIDEMIIKQWNDTISPTDQVIHLGDFTGNIGQQNIKTGYETSDSTIDHYKAIMGRLNGIKTLRKGNHDKHGNEFYYKIGFSSVSGENIIAPGLIMSHKPLQHRRNRVNICGHIHDGILRTLLHHTAEYIDVAWKHNQVSNNIHKVIITETEMIIDGCTYRHCSANTDGF